MEGSKTIMGGSESLLTVIVSLSRKIYKSVSQNMCCGIMFSGLPGNISMSQNNMGKFW